MSLVEPRISEVRSEVASPASAAKRPCGIERSLSGWSYYDRQTCRIYRPEKIADLARTVAAAGERTLISRGLGRSYNDAALNAGGAVVLSERLKRLLAFDARTGELQCEAGVSIGEIIEFGLPRGWFPAVTPGTKFVTVGGAIAADVHGKNHHRDGSFASCVREFRLLAASGETLTCSRMENAEVFWATLGGMGLTGAVLDAKLALRAVSSAYLTVDYRRAPNLDAALEEFAARDRDYAYSVAWIDGLARGKSLGRSVLMRGRHSAAAELPRPLADRPLVCRPRPRASVPCYLPGGLLNSWTVRAFNALYYRRQYDRQALAHYDTFFYPLDGVSHWNRLYGRRGFAQYQAAFPEATGRQGVAALLEKLSSCKAASFLAVLKTFGAGNEGLLSFPVKGHTLALDLPHSGRLPALMNELDEIVLAHGGRVYLAKNPRLSRSAFERMYPEAERFRRVLDRLDPDERFASSLSRRLGLRGIIE
jgi:decaprenylphospho-beta-D-ribofuranose 2-oxidase